MITRVTMPKFTKHMTHGSILMWKMEEGAAVTQGDIIADIETDTAIMELEAHGSGFLRHILISEGSPIKTDTLLAIIGDLDDDTDSIVEEAMKSQHLNTQSHEPSKLARSQNSKRHSQQEEPVTTAPTSAAACEESAAPPHTLECERASTARSRTSQKRIQCHETKESKDIHGEAIEDVLEVVRDVLENVTTLEYGQTETCSLPLDPHDNDRSYFHLTTDVSMAEGERLREQMMEIQHIPLSLTTLYVRAAALAFSRLPTFFEACFEQDNSIDIGIGIIMDNRVLTPTLRDCGRKNIAELASEIEDSTKRIRTGEALSEETSDVNFSIFHFGMYPIEQFIPILTPSQSGALSIGAIRDMPFQEGRHITTDCRTTITLTCQETRVDKEQASDFLGYVKQILERPLAIFLPNPVE